MKMIRKIAASLSLALGLLGSAHSIEPQDMKSLQPFTTFAVGKGHGMALTYQVRDKAALVALLRSGDKQLRVPCTVLTSQLAEAHPGFPAEGCEGAAHEVETSSDYAVVACEDRMFLTENALTVTSADGKSFGVWHRRCYKDELVLTYKGRPILSTTCVNVVIPMTPAPVARAITPPVAAGKCPNGFPVVVFEWDLSTITDANLRKQADALIAAAERRESDYSRRISAYTPDVPAFSRTLGEKMRETQTPAQRNSTVAVRLLEPSTHELREDLGSLGLYAGVGSRTLTYEQSRLVIEVVFPPDVKSPANSGGAGRILRFYPSEGGPCWAFMHGAVEGLK